MDKTRVMEKKLAFSHKNTYLLHTTDKHGVPPTKRLFRVAMLDPSPEFIGPWGTSGDGDKPTLGMAHKINAPDVKEFRILGMVFCRLMVGNRILIEDFSDCVIGTNSVPRYGYVKYCKKSVKKRTRERMSDQEAKELKAEAREIMPQPSSVNCS
ncbi:hypothetical protein Tco_0499141 [Tanacetum coccineum]